MVHKIRNNAGIPTLAKKFGAIPKKYLTESFLLKGGQQNSNYLLENKQYPEHRYCE